MNGIIIISLFSLMGLLLLYLIYKLATGMKKNLYDYKHIRRFGLMLFILMVLFFESIIFFDAVPLNHSLSLTVFLYYLRDGSTLFAVLMIPVTGLLTFFVTLSSVILVIKEGRTWRNILGIILGGTIVLASLVFLILYDKYFFTSELLLLICGICLLIVAYLECILLGTIIISIISAKHKPKKEKDYIIILGCMVNKDGSLPNLLKSRVDRAIWFANRQKEKFGKDIIFVPSGGQGSDEPMSEGDAMKKYLIEQGIDKKNILVENKSTTTNQNIKYSVKLIKEKNKDARIAFSTTNYHVFRAGYIASKQHIYIEGIGAKTKIYFWINAFIREFVATLVNERKTNIITILILTALYVISYFVI